MPKYAEKRFTTNLTRFYQHMNHLGDKSQPQPPPAPSSGWCAAICAVIRQAARAAGAKRAASGASRWSRQLWKAEKILVEGFFRWGETSERPSDTGFF